MTELQPKLPDVQDLLEQIRFDNEEGKIWLNEQRMLLIHSAVMGLLRNELIQTLGVERAKGFLMRFGYHTGWRDAELAKKVRPDMTAEEVFMAGPQLHAIKGMVKVVPISLEFDQDSQHFFGSFDWYNSHEVETHLANFGNSDVPVCWTLIGYASGFSTYYMNRQIIFRETQCAGTGADHCHIEGRPAEDWDDSEEMEKYIIPDPIIEKLLDLQDEGSDLKDQSRRNDAEEDLLSKSVGTTESSNNV